jgi:glycosyltransferase involved in cell wall biosynthesis
MSSPTVSIILPVYNGERYLGLAVESVLAQTLRDFELIVIDDGSRDSTPEIARSYGARLRYVRQENTGVAGAVNHGLRLAAGRYISWLSHDDLFLPEKLERQVAALGRVGAPAVCYTDVEMIDSAGEVVAERRLPEYGRGEALRHVLTAGEIGLASYSICYDRRCLEEVGFYSERWPHTQDAEMLARLARRFHLVRVPELLTRVREHEGRGIRSRRWEREVVRFYRAQLASTPFAELFPGAGASAADRSRA